MPHYAIHCIDKPHAGDLRAQTRETHLDHVRALGDKVLIGGPLLDDAGAPIGSLLVIDFEDRKAALTFAAEDPYAKAGLFASVAVTSWRQVFPEGA
ncbi:MAG: YciI family protein [Pacificimonas sp.]|jgi:uncharacterized protein YciI|nr:YciI family protein [Pacificimonas sp.]